MIDARSDVFALGVVLHGRSVEVPPLSGKTAAEALAALRSGTIPLLFTEQKDAPAELVSIAEKRCKQTRRIAIQMHAPW